MKKIYSFALFILFAFLLLSCRSSKAANRSADLRSPPDVRIDDIVMYIQSDPARAIHLMEVFKIIYGEGSAVPQAAEVFERLVEYREEAISNLISAQINAVEEGQWNEAASLARSLSSLGVIVESTGEEPDIVLEYALHQLAEGNTLNAFLAAYQAHELRPLIYEDAILFLEKAVEVRQRRTAAFFLDIIDSIIASETSNIERPALPIELRTYAEGRDTAAEMILGVATVLVDRGIRIERGQGFPDRVLGSAFFIDASGLLITNYHVIASEVDPTFRGTSRTYIRLGDHTSPRIPARVIGWDMNLDLALLKVEVDPEYVFSVIDWALPSVGESILAIGSPGGLERTVTQGIVSAMGRRFLQIGDVMQIDAAVNMGNSGGPVVNMDGRLVGVVFAGIQNYEGLNFAIPAYRLAAALPAMIAGGKSDRPWLGLSIAETPDGAEIIYVTPTTPAAEQRIQEGSIIRSINGESVSTAQGALTPSLQDILYPLSPGELISLELLDPEENIVTYTIRLESRPDIPMLFSLQRDTRERIIAPLFGMLLSPRASSGLFSPSHQVQRVIRGSIADEAGISEGDQLSIRNLRIFENEGYALLDIDIRKRRMGFLEISMRLPALLETPDTL